MGLGKDSMGKKACCDENILSGCSNDDRIIALAGNPNVGKSTVFNELTGLKQHTGNWTGKTVTNAIGKSIHNNKKYVFIDIPGCYSLLSYSKEEEVARDIICSDSLDAVVVVCDATALERNFNLVLQILEITQNVVVCINLLDEAKRKKIEINLEHLSSKLGVPVIGVCAKKRSGLNQIYSSVEKVISQNEEKKNLFNYPEYIEKAICQIEPYICEKTNDIYNNRWLALMLLIDDYAIIKKIEKQLMVNIIDDLELRCEKEKIISDLAANKISKEQLKDDVAKELVNYSASICKSAVKYNKKNYDAFDRKMDKVLTSKATGFPIMFMALMLIFYITIIGANYPSELLSNFLFWIEGKLVDFSVYIGVPKLVYEFLIYGVYRVLAWVVSVMLPPMAIFFPLFTLLEDLGYLPRIAFCVDKCFKRCAACGKQALTMAMGLGCNAAGVVGCRIIDSKRERLIAIITNNFMPCNGRFPTLIAIITMFFIGGRYGGLNSILSAFFLALIIVLGIFMTFVTSKTLSKTILKGQSSAFTLELPSYRKPQIIKVIVHSIFDRTLFVLGRAIIIAIPAGAIIWLMANIYIGDSSLLIFISQGLDPFARLIGLDGIILLAFILGFPANEIVIPIIIMAYMSNGKIIEINDLSFLKGLLVANGWTVKTGICVILFSMFHWPCSTTLLSIRKETKSIKWTFVSFIVPTLIGILMCASVNLVFTLLNI